MRITLIEPAPPGFHVYSFIKQVRLGLPLLGTLLRDRGHDVRIMAEGLGELDWSRILSSDLVGISSITSTAIKAYRYAPVSYTHLRAHETDSYLVCRLLLETKKKTQ